MLPLLALWLQLQLSAPVSVTFVTAATSLSLGFDRQLLIVDCKTLPVYDLDYFVSVAQPTRVNAVVVSRDQCYDLAIRRVELRMDEALPITVQVSPMMRAPIQVQLSPTIRAPIQVSVRKQ